MYDKIPSDLSYPPPSCLDSAYERKAIDDGFLFEHLFPENKQYYFDKRKKYESRNISNPN